MLSNNLGAVFKYHTIPIYCHLIENFNFYLNNGFISQRCEFVVSKMCLNHLQNIYD